MTASSLFCSVYHTLQTSNGLMLNRKKANYIQTNKNGGYETYLCTGVNTCRRIQSGTFLALRVQLWRDLDRLVWLGSGPHSLKQPFTDLATTIPHCRQLCAYDTAATAVCVCVFSLHIKTVGRLTYTALSHTAGGWRVLTPLVCAYVRSLT